MSGTMLDASALLALAFKEPGADIVAAVLGDAAVSVVNLSEAGAKMIEKGFDPDHAIGWLLTLGLRILPFEAVHADRAARLRTDLTRKKLSFADRACIATAALENARALTTDRIWEDLDLPCKVELIR